MRKTLSVFAFLLLIAAWTLFPADPALSATEHCPNHQDGGKVEGQNNVEVLDAGTEFCVKAGTFATGLLVADGTTSLIEYVEDSGITVGNGNVPDVSYYVVYTTPEPEPEPEPTPDEPVEQPIENTPAPNTVEAGGGPPTLPNTGVGTVLLMLLGLALTGGGWYTLRRT